MLYDTPNPATLLANLLVVIAGTLALRAAKVAPGEVVTRAEDYEMEVDDPRLKPLPGTPERSAAQAQPRPSHRRCAARGTRSRPAANNGQDDDDRL